jgi:hypothetical protein
MSNRKVFEILKDTKDNCTDLEIEFIRSEYENGQEYLLLYKLFYYNKNESIISDEGYDVLEKLTEDMRAFLGVDKVILAPSFMVGFNKDTPYWDRVLDRFGDIIRRAKIKY